MLPALNLAGLSGHPLRQAIPKKPFPEHSTISSGVAPFTGED